MKRKTCKSICPGCFKKPIVCILIGLFIWANTCQAQRLSKENITPKNFYIGIDNSGDKCKPEEFFNAEAMKALGVDFVVYHYRGPKGTIGDEIKKMERLGNSFNERGLKVIVNVESGNWSLDMASTDGHNWVKQPGNLHLFKFPPEVLKSLNK